MLEGFAKTMDLRFMNGRLQQKCVAGHPGAETPEEWIEVEDATPAESDQTSSGELKPLLKKTASSADSKT